MEWSYHAPDVRRYDVVVSDNHPEILYSRTDAVISGNFLWHDSIEGVAQSYKEQCEELLQARNPVVVATDLFASERVKAFPKYRPVGLYAPYKPSTVLDGPGFLLLSAGKSGACQEPFMDAVAALAAEGPGPFQGVLVDGELMPRESDVAAPWIQRATFDHEMYLSVTASICRPGVGTLTELLQTGGRPFCLHEEGNLEMDRNTEALTAGGLGDRFDDALTAVKEAKKFAADRRRREKHNNALARLDFKGIEQTCDILVTLG